MKLAHFSDIHFWRFNTSPTQFFSKQWIGNFHALLTRQRIFNPDLVYQVVAKLHELEVTHLLITGDFTSSSTSYEFFLTRKYLDHLKKQGFTYYILPGNHDAYTKKFFKNNRFYQQLSSATHFVGDLPFNLNEDRVAAHQLTENWWLILLDCAVPNKFNRANGLFHEKTEEKLQALLEKLPKSAQLIVANHFPFDAYKYPLGHLKRGDALKTILQGDSRVQLFLHGHRHKQRCEHVKPFIIDSGSISLKTESCFTLLNLELDAYHVQPFKSDLITWEPMPFQKTVHFGCSHE